MLTSTAKPGYKIYLGYGTPWLFITSVVTPALLILPSLYAQYTHVTLAQVGLILIITRMLDALTDPLIGYLSDNTRTPFGARKPWIVAGTLLMLPAVWFLFHPTQESGMSYFLIWGSLYILSNTMVSVPGAAWGAELTRQPEERARLFSMREMFTHVGGAVYALLPIILYSRYGTTALSLDVMNDIAIFAVVTIPISIGIMLLVVPSGEKSATAQVTLAAVYKTFRKNSLLWRYLLVYLVSSIGLGMFVGIQFLFFADYMKMAPAFPFIAITSGVTIFVAIPLWMRLINRFGTPKAWSWALISAAPISPVIWLIKPGMESLIPVLIVVVLGGIILAGHYAASPILLSDVIDYDTLKSGSNKAGNLFSAALVVSKAAYAGGAGLALMLVGLFGYTPGTENSQLAMFGMAFSFSIMPGILLAMAGLMLIKYPVTPRKQAVIRQRLQHRAARSQPNPTRTTRHPQGQTMEVTNGF